MILKKHFKFLTNKWIWLSIFTSSLIAFSGLSWKSINHLINKNQLNQLNNQKIKQENLISWGTSESRRLIDLFPQTQIALEVLNQLKNSIADAASVFAHEINSLVTKEQLGKIKILNLTNMDLVNIDEILNPDFIWTNLYSINLSNNNFKNYDLVFKKAKMPKLYKIIATNANLNQMINVSDYVIDPFDTSTNDSSPARSSANGQYINPATANVPRYFDLANNNIKEIPKYYLKINLGYLNLANNKLGMGTLKDPMGVNATPWYSLLASLGSNNFLKIQDSSIRGPYGINVYNTGEKNSDGGYKYTDEQVARWRQSPFPIKGLTFGNYNDQPTDSDGSITLDSGVTHASRMKPSSGKKAPFFNFANNNLVAPMIFDQSNVKYDPNSTIVPQEKSVNVFVGLNDYKKSEYYTSQQAIIDSKKSEDPNNPNANAEMLVPQPDSIYPFLNQNGFSATKSRAEWRWNRPLFNVYTIRSFNGFGLFEQTTDSRTTGLDYDQWDNNPGTDNKVKNAGTTSQEGGGIKWTVPKASDFKGNSANKFNDRTGAFNITDFITASGSQSGKKKTGWWGTDDTKIDITKGSTNDQPILSFDDTKESSAQTHYKRYKPFRTYLITAKSFAKTDPKLAYSKVFDGNVFYDSVGYENYNFNIQLFPSGSNQTTYDPNYNTLALQTASNNNSSIMHFVNFYPTNQSLLLDSLAPANWISNIDRDSSFGIKKDQKTPYSVYYNSSNGLYKYSSFYNVIDTIATELDNESNFATKVENQNNLDLSEYANKFPQNINSVNIINGKDKFWKSTKQFDQVYISKLKSEDIKISYDSLKGELKYEFNVYSPGYSRNGRLFNKDDSIENLKNETKTIDLNLTKTITGFAKAKLQLENPTGTFEDISETNISSNNTISKKAPKSIIDKITKVSEYKNLNETLIAQAFKTNYLGNKVLKKIDSSLIENNQDQLETLDQNSIKNIVKNGINGTIEFNIEIPDYRFTNNNILEYPKKLKEVTYIFTDLPKAQTELIGKNPTSTSANATFKPFVTATFVDGLGSKLELFKTIKNKPANAITAKDIFDLNTVIKTDVSTWKSTVTADNASDYITLYPNDANGSLLFQIKFPNDSANFINEHLITVLWDGLFKQTTSLNWKPQNALDSLLTGQTPTEVIELFKKDPSKFLDWTNPPPQEKKDSASSLLARKISIDDLEFDESTNVIKDVTNGKIQFINIKLKNFYQNGSVFKDGINSNSSSVSSSSSTSPKTYLDVLISPNYQAQPPVSNAPWESDANILKAIKDYLKKNNLIQLNPNEFDLTDVSNNEKHIETILNAMNVYDYYQAIINFNLNLADIGAFKKLENITTADFVFNPISLKNDIEVNNQTGELTFKNLQFNNWQEKNSTKKSTHILKPHTINANPVINSFKFSNNLTNALAILPAGIIANIFQSPTQASKYIDGLNVGKKTFDPKTNKLLNNYIIDPTKIKVDVIKGELTFEANAITVTNFVAKKDAKPTNHVVAETKTYKLSSKLTTNYYINTLITSSNGYKNKFASFFFNQNYDDASVDQKNLIDNDFNNLNAPNLVFKSPYIATGLIKQSVINNNGAKISKQDLEQINTLKNRSENNKTKEIDFSNYFYLPKYLAFVSSLTSSGINRTYFIASNIKTLQADAAFLVVKNVFIVNYFKEGKVDLLSLGDLVYPGFLWNGTVVNFKKEKNKNLPDHLKTDLFNENQQPNLLSDFWKNKTPKQMQSDLAFLFNNRNNESIKSSTKWLNIANAWKQTFEYKNVLFDGAQDKVVVYPSKTTISSSEHTLRVDELLFPYFINTKFKDNSTTAVSLDQKIDVSEIWYLNKGNDTIFKLNPKSAYENFLFQPPKNALKNLNLKEGIQDDPQKTFNFFLNQKIYSLLNIDPSVLTNNQNLPNYLIPVGEINSISIIDSTGIMRLSGIKIKNAWKNGKLIDLSLNDINLEFALISSKVFANNSNDIITWLKSQFGANKTLTELLFSFQTAIKNKTFNVKQFNQMLQSNKGFVILSSIFSDPKTKVEFNQTFNFENSIKIDYLNATINLTNLQIINGYLLNIKQTNPIIVNPITINLKSDFSTDFNANFQPIIDSKEFNGFSPSSIQHVLETGSFDLNQYIKYNHPFEKIETPEIKISANDVLGTITFDVHFSKYYQNGILIGSKSFRFEYTHLKAWLPLILGLISAFVGISLFVTAFLLYRYYKGKKDRYLQTVCKDDKKS